MVMKYLEQIRGMVPVQKIPESSEPTPPSILSNSSILSVNLPLEMRDHHSLHPHPELVNQVQLVVDLLHSTGSSGAGSHFSRNYPRTTVLFS